MTPEWFVVASIALNIGAMYLCWKLPSIDMETRRTLRTACLFILIICIVMLILVREGEP